MILSLVYLVTNNSDWISVYLGYGNHLVLITELCDDFRKKAARHVGLRAFHKCMRKARHGYGNAEAGPGVSDHERFHSYEH